MKDVRELFQKKIAVVGLGESGVAVARFCVKHGAQLTVLDDKPATKLEKSLEALSSYNDIQYSLGGLDERVLLEADLILISPGVPPSLNPLEMARRAQQCIMGELEFAAQFIRAPLVGITGTNGKSTVTSLCGAIAQETGRPSFCGGNLGVPLIEVVGTPAAEEGGLVVAEMSSFQLEAVTTLHCRAAAVLNLTADHLDRYDSMDAYAAAKARIAFNQTADDVLVLNADDSGVLQALEKQPQWVRRCLFSVRPDAESTLAAHFSSHAFIRADHFVLRLKSETSTRFVEETYPMSEFQLVGRHNQANALAAFLLMRASNLATYDQVRLAAKKFKALAHRMELIHEAHGIRYYDDSKGTNVDSVAAGLAGFPRPFALIAGGRDKGGGYEPLARSLAENTVRGVVLIGEAAPLIEAALQNTVKTYRASSMADAVKRAISMCTDGDAVILSPACSSYDMFDNYLHRSQVFSDAVQKFSSQTGE